MNKTHIIPREFPGSPMIRLHTSIAGGMGLISGQGAKIPQQARPKKKRQTLFLNLGAENLTDTNISIIQRKIFIERTDAEAETPILWPPDSKR